MRLVIATRNAHKVEEIRGILSHRFDYLTLRDFTDAPEIAEDAPTFSGNAVKKAAALACWLATSGKLQQAWILADDSGLEVDALHGAPGVHSARFAAMEESLAAVTKNSPDEANNARLLRLLENVPLEKRTARFRCVLALLRIEPQLKTAQELAKTARIFEGTCEGRIALAPSGSHGFGYDPLFLPAGHDRSFAELGAEVKNTLSHRARALRQLRNSFGDFS